MQLSPTEVARRFGVSVKTLRLYERRGLIKPLRSRSGWRTYGPDHVSRLHQIVALKRLGLPLASIAIVLSSTNTLRSVLAIQEQLLTRESQRLSRALALVRAARAKLELGHALSIDDLTQLAKETSVASKLTRPTLFHPALVPHQHKYFRPDEIEALANREGFDQEREIAVMFGLITELKALVAKGDPGSGAALDLGKRWRAQTVAFTGGNQEMAGRLRAMVSDALADSVTGPQLPFSAQDVAFLGKIMEKLKAVKA